MLGEQEHPQMGSKAIREWAGINTFAPATQTKLLELLGELKQEVLFFLKFIYILFETIAHVFVVFQECTIACL